MKAAIASGYLTCSISVTALKMINHDTSNFSHTSFIVTYKTCFSLFSSADGAERTKNQEHLHSRYLISCRAEVLYVRSSYSCSVSPNFSCSWKQGSVPFNSQICWWWGCEWTKQCGDLSSLTDRRSTQWRVDTVLLFFTWCLHMLRRQMCVELKICPVI